MKIGIDAHALGTGAGGNETFVHQLLEGLHLITPESDILAFVHDSVHRRLNVASGFHTSPLTFSSSWLRVPLELPYRAYRKRLDLLHVQYIAPPVSPCPTVVTVHDIVWTKYPEFLPPLDRLRLQTLVPLTMRRATRIHAVTEAMRKSIAETYDVPLEKIDLIQTACDPSFHPVKDEEKHARVRRRYDIDGPFVLYIGALTPRKNVARLAEGMARLGENGFDHKLVITGKPSWLHKDVTSKLESLTMGDRLKFTGYVDKEDLPTLITAADAFAYVSIYEGYGLPVIEAMACATPVLASTDPAITEVAGGAALHCDPMSVDAIAHSLERILTDNDLREDLIRRGPERAAAFTRERMGRAAIESYSNAVLGIDGPRG